MLASAGKTFKLQNNKDKSGSLFTRYPYNYQVVFGLATLAIVIWIALIISAKIRRDFFAIESIPIHFKSVDITKSSVKTPFLFAERRAALSVVILSGDVQAQTPMQIAFESGETFTLPEQVLELGDYLEKRRKNIILSAMTLRLADPASSRTKIWQANDGSFANIRYLINILARYGFDDFDIAVGRPRGT